MVIVNAKTGNGNDRDEGQALTLCFYPLLAKECLLLVQFPSKNSPKNGLNQQEMLNVLQIRMSYCQNVQYPIGKNGTKTVSYLKNKFKKIT